MTTATVSPPVATTYDQVAKKLIVLTRSNGEEVSQTKIQKLVYYCYAWFLVSSKKKAVLFEDKMQAWVYGPVVPALYNNWNEIVSDETLEEPELNANLSKLISMVYTKYGTLDKYSIVELTHQETPWKNARIGTKPLDLSSEELSLDDIYDFYSKSK